MKTKLSRIVSSILVILMITAMISPVVFSDNENTTVYRTRTGSCYHTYGCSYLKSCISVSLYDAINVYGLRACSRCKPPVLDAISATPKPIATPKPVATPRQTTTPKPTTTTSNTKSNSATSTSYNNANSHNTSTTTVIIAALGAVSAISLIATTTKSKEIQSLTSKNSQLKNEIKQIKESQEKEIANERAVLQAEYNQLMNEKEGELLKAKHLHKKLENAVSEFERSQSEDKRRNAYKALYEGKSLLQCAGAPADCYVSEDGYPARKGPLKYGRDYSVFITMNGKCYHSKKGCSSATYEIHLFDAQEKGKVPCSVCMPKTPDSSWFEKYKKIEKIKKEYNIK